jgi:tetratricopeptide (TPR) repeat protein
MEDFEVRVAHLWDTLDDHEDADFRDLVFGLADEAPTPGIADFERACAWDSTGHSDKAVPLYRSALDHGLEGVRRRRAVLQLASSLRNVGEVDVALELLTEERARTSDELDDALVAILALTLVAAGRPVEATSYAVEALAPHLPRYQRSMAAYARALRED